MATKTLTRKAKTPAKPQPSLASQRKSVAAAVLKINNSDLIQYLAEIIHQGGKVKKRITKKQYNKEIEAAENRMAKGEFISNDAVMREMKSW